MMRNIMFIRKSEFFRIHKNSVFDKNQFLLEFSNYYSYTSTAVLHTSKLNLKISNEISKT